MGLHFHSMKKSSPQLFVPFIKVKGAVSQEQWLISGGWLTGDGSVSHGFRHPLEQGNSTSFFKLVNLFGLQTGWRRTVLLLDEQVIKVGEKDKKTFFYITN